MSSFQVLGKRVTVEPHPDADRLDVVRVDGYQCVSEKGRWQTGDVAVYIPEQAVVPDNILHNMDLLGKLAGPQSNRVKAIKLRGIVSQGLLAHTKDLGLFGNPCEGTDYADITGISKWVPVIPSQLAGDVEPGPIKTYTDIENIKKFPNVLWSDEPVVVTEKLHGTCSIFSLVDGEFYVSSKGLAGRGLVLKKNDSNLYWRVAHKYDLEDKLRDLARIFHGSDTNGEITLFGETLGVQDLKYGVTKGEVITRFFDLRVNDIYVPPFSFDWYVGDSDAGTPTVPRLFTGVIAGDEHLAKLTGGKSTIADHVREGVVIRPIAPRENEFVGRVIFKSINPKYLLRKGDVTEYE